MQELRFRVRGVGGGAGPCDALFARFLHPPGVRDRKSEREIYIGGGAQSAPPGSWFLVFGFMHTPGLIWPNPKILTPDKKCAGAHRLWCLGF